VADSVTFRFSGGDEYLVDLEHWRHRLQAEVHQSARDQANLVGTVVAAHYPVKTGNLRSHVTVKDESYGDALTFRVRTLARHSHLYEKGTKARRTRQGWNRGVMPAHPLFIPEAIAKRQAFKTAVRRILGSPEPALGRGNPTVTGSL
jgi:hypothetical protein